MEGWKRNEEGHCHIACCSFLSAIQRLFSGATKNFFAAASLVSSSSSQRTSNKETNNANAQLPSNNHQNCQNNLIVMHVDDGF